MAWLAEVEPKADSGLLGRAADYPFEADRYLYGMAGPLAEIGPRVRGNAGGREVLLPCAVLACYRAGVEFPVAIPPGLVILSAGALVVTLVIRPWAALVGAFLGLFVLVGFLASILAPGL